MPLTPDILATFLIDGASAHARNDDPDHEVGDLQDAIRTILDSVPSDLLASLARNPKLLGIICGLGPNEPTEFAATDLVLPDPVAKALAAIEDSAGSFSNEDLAKLLFQEPPTESDPAQGEPVPDLAGPYRIECGNSNTGTIGFVAYVEHAASPEDALDRFKNAIDFDHHKISVRPDLDLVIFVNPDNVAIADVEADPE